MMMRLFAALLVVGAGVSGTAQETCPAGRRPYGDLGVGLFQCVRGDCMLAGRNSSDSAHHFTVEPTLWYIAEGFRGKLVDGDALVAVNDFPITTTKGGATLATIRPGETATLLVRRGAALIRVPLVARGWCERPSIQVTSGVGTPEEVTRRVRALLSKVGAATPDTESSRFSARLALTIEQVDSASRLWKAGFRSGDVLIAVDGRPLAEMYGSLSTLPMHARFTLRRGGRVLELGNPLATSP